jgi:hypothetical protein
VSTGPAFRAPIPVLRMFDTGRSRDFYVGFLGLRVDRERRFEPALPLYMQVSAARSSCISRSIVATAARARWSMSG